MLSLRGTKALGDACIGLLLEGSIDVLGDLPHGAKVIETDTNLRRYLTFMRTTAHGQISLLSVKPSRRGDLALSMFNVCVCMCLEDVAAGKTTTPSMPP